MTKHSRVFEERRKFFLKQQSNLDTLKKLGKIIVFVSETCPHCIRLKKDIHDHQWEDHIDFKPIQEHLEEAKTYGIEALPTAFVFSADENVSPEKLVKGYGGNLESWLEKLVATLDEEKN